MQDQLGTRNTEVSTEMQVHSVLCVADIHLLDSCLLVPGQDGTGDGMSTFCATRAFLTTLSASATPRPQQNCSGGRAGVPRPFQAKEAAVWFPSPLVLSGPRQGWLGAGVLAGGREGGGKGLGGSLPWARRDPGAGSLVEEYCQTRHMASYAETQGASSIHTQVQHGWSPASLEFTRG